MINEKTISREFDAKLRLIAEDICNKGSSDVGLYHQRGEIRGNGEAIVEALNKHVAACEPNSRVEAVDRSRCDGLFNSGVPFLLHNGRTGETLRLQICGGDNGTGTWEYADDGEYQRRLAAQADSARQQVQRQASKSNRTVFVNETVQKLWKLSRTMTLTAQQKTDFEYHMRSLPDKPITSEYSVDGALPYLFDACAALGITFESVVTSN